MILWIWLLLVLAGSHKTVHFRSFSFLQAQDTQCTAAMAGEPCMAVRSYALPHLICCYSDS